MGSYWTFMISFAEFWGGLVWDLQCFCSLDFCLDYVICAP